jgi:hypothetical protein
MFTTPPLPLSPRANILRLQENDGSALFAQDASWYELADTNTEDSSFRLFRSFNFPKAYLAHLANRAGVDSLVLRESNQLAAEDFSFRMVYPALGSQGLPCDGVKTYQDEIFQVSFDEGYGSAAADRSFGGAKLRLIGEPDWIGGQVGLAVNLDASGDNGEQYMLVDEFWTTPLKEFTFSVWVKPAAGMTTGIDPEKNAGIIALRKTQRFVLYPSHGSTFKDNTAAGIGLAVGTNAVAVYAHSGSFFPCLLSHQVTLDAASWTHVVVVVKDNKPALYLNGELAREGVQATRNLAFSPKLMGRGSDTFGIAYGGGLDELDAFSRALSADEVKDMYITAAGLLTTKCTKVAEGGTAELSCSEGMVIADITFASYGTADGTCGSFAANDACHSEISEIQLKSKCIGKQDCNGEDGECSFLLTPPFHFFFPSFPAPCCPIHPRFSNSSPIFPLTPVFFSHHAPQLWPTTTTSSIHVAAPSRR